MKRFQICDCIRDERFILQCSGSLAWSYDGVYVRWTQLETSSRRERSAEKTRSHSVHTSLRVLWFICLLIYYLFYLYHSSLSAKHVRSCSHLRYSSSKSRSLDSLSFCSLVNLIRQVTETLVCPEDVPVHRRLLP